MFGPAPDVTAEVVNTTTVTGFAVRINIGDSGDSGCTALFQIEPLEHAVGTALPVLGAGSVVFLAIASKPAISFIRTGLVSGFALAISSIGEFKGCPEADAPRISADAAILNAAATALRDAYAPRLMVYGCRCGLCVVWWIPSGRFDSIRWRSKSNA